MQTLLDVVEAHAETHPDDLAITLVTNGATAARQLTYRMLVTRAREVAHQLSEARLAGERTLLVYSTMLDFAAGLLGCFRAGVIAVPVYPPSPHRASKPLHAIVRDCGAAAVLTTARRRDSLIDHFAELSRLRIIATDDEVDRAPAPAAWAAPAITADHLAFLQYTSGTTRSPRGVMVSHGNLLANLEMIRRQFGARRTVRCGSWLPLFHDMGLIGTLLLPLYVGMHALHMSPIDFLKRPLHWLQMISSFHIGFSGGPNFAYDYCALRIPEEQKAGLDLGCWEVAFNGAEPVRADTIERFVNAFAVCGFRREAFYPCYGMAEATLFATGPRHGELRPIIQRFDAAALERGEAVAASQDQPTRTLVSCGTPDPALTVEIVDPERCVRCASGRVGEIWLAGPSVTHGYWGPSDASAEFEAHLLDEQGQEVAQPFYRTGDLGVMHGAELHVTGRRKDMVIIKGRNHYPQDIEMTVAHCHPAVRRGGVAAFAIELDACEALGVAIEIDHRAIDDPAAMQEILQTVRRAVAAEHEVAIGLAVLLRTGSLPRTTSGKLRRSACLHAMATGALPSCASIGTLPTVASLASIPRAASGETL